jgi:uncharacterized protein (DUF488 family)
MDPADRAKGLTLLTVGHGRLDRASLGCLLTGVGVDLVVDVRRFPGSRMNPDVKTEALAVWLPALGIDYRWDERLGGRRRLIKDQPVLDDWWTVSAFRAYAAYTRTAPFEAGMGELLTDAGSRAVAIMCSESVWWRCHRRLIADVASLAHDCSTRHLMPGGALVDHRVAAGARLRRDGRVVWDGR